LREQAKLGNRWSIISAMLPGRTEDAVKIRWKTLDRKQRQNNNSPKKSHRSRKQLTRQCRTKSISNRFTLESSSLHSDSAFPISDSVKSTIVNGEPGVRRSLLKVETVLGNEFLDWTQQIDTTLNHLPTLTKSSLNCWHQTSGIRCVKPEISSHRYRAESLEWLEDALLSPVFKGVPPNSTPSGKFSTAAKNIQEHTHRQIPQLQAAGLRLQLSSELIGLAQSGQPSHKIGSPGSPPMSSTVNSISCSSPLQPCQLTPPQPCHQSARMNAVVFPPCINPPNMIKDEDLDHFLTDMDLENLGGALENRLSFGSLG